MISALEIDQAIETLPSKLGRPPVEIEVAEALHTSLADYRKAVHGPDNYEGDDSYTSEDVEDEKRAMTEEMKRWTASAGWPQYDRPSDPEVSAEWLPPGAVSVRRRETLDSN